ncbi:hypothetical protein LEP1GSC073_3896 [Leptospira noguchii str. Cascata]|nr:hypothetical protein LEP1GSC073_3896 [Leptospira noguchii str. Cascata]
MILQIISKYVGTNTNRDFTVISKYVGTTIFSESKIRVLLLSF